jgi:hypothetical protein
MDSPCFVVPVIMNMKGKRLAVGDIENFLYIGRECCRGGWDLSTSKWANPFSVRIYGDEAVKRYETYVRASDHLMNSLHELNGKVLGCWCVPEPCHGHILAKLFRERFC